jgi:cytochrome c
MKLLFTTLAALVITIHSAGAFAGPAEDLIAANKCSKCHTATTTKKGPSWASVAEKYKGKPEAEAKLVEMLKTGGKTTDGDDHNKVTASDADLKAIVAIVLSSK